MFLHWGMVEIWEGDLGVNRLDDDDAYLGEPLSKALLNQTHIQSRPVVRSGECQQA